MYRIVKKEALKPTVTLYEIEAPMVAKKAEPGQFIILRVDENGERIPITIHDFDREKGTVTIIVQTIGATTEKLRHKAEGEYIQDFVGPLGRPTETEGKKKVCVVGGGVGCAIAYPVLKKFHDCGAEVHAVVGFKNKDLVILEDKFRAASSVLKLMTDDGSYGEKGLVTDALKALIDAGNQYDEIFAIGPAIHEPDHGRRHRHVRRLPPHRRRRDEVRLRRRPGLRRSQGRLGRESQARQDVLRLGAPQIRRDLQPVQQGGSVICLT